MAPPELGPRPFETAFQPLVRSVVYQQLSGKAAATIFGRLAVGFGDGEWPAAPRVASAELESLRAVGLSRQKATYILDLARAEVDGDMPHHRELEALDDEAIIRSLTAFRGIGRWTVEMLLMFWLGRPDVLPIDDLGIRKGIQLIDGLERPPTPREAAARGERWRPFRSVASWYLWRATET